MEQLTDRIDRYLDGAMNAEEQLAFENEMQASAELQQQVDVQRSLRAGIERLGMKATVSSTFKKMTLKNKIYKWGVATVAVTAIATAAYFGYPALTGSVTENYELPELNEDGTSIWADADRNLPTQLFEIDPSKDTVIETEGGLIFAIPAGAFLNAENPVTLEIREALTPMDVMKGGLSTTSDGQLLETGGMFYLNARNDEASLKLNPAKPIYANVPANELRPDMLLFTGERMPDGSINWKDPKPLDKPLVPVDIHSLNFYPDGFLHTLEQLGFDVSNKQLTDSIYYSYAGRASGAAPGGTMTRSDSVRVRHILISHRDAEHSATSRTKEQARKLADSLQRVIASGKVKMEDLVMTYSNDPGSKGGNKGDYGWLTQNSGFVQPFIDAGFNNPVGATVVAETDFGFHVIRVLAKTPPRPMDAAGPMDAGAMFAANCASCHKLSDQKGTGPGMKGVLDRIPGGNWKYDWVHDNNALRARGDAYANKIFREYNGTPMNSFPLLTNSQIDAILAYASAGGNAAEIDPSRIAAIWNDKFQNTVIATKEFEERLHAIFHTCEPNILDLYVGRLNRPLWETDSMVYARYGRPEFRDYYLRRDGGVNMSQPHMEELQAYMAKKREAVKLAAQRTLIANRTKEQAEDSSYFSMQLNQVAKDGERSNKNFSKEFDINLTEAYRQLGIQKVVPPPAPAYYSFTVPATGWNNVDRYVFESTMNRTTLDYTDPATGKRAVIKYEELKINIADQNSYEQLRVYLVSDSLPCFQKVNVQNGAYTEKLNELLRYSLVVIAMKGEQWYWTKVDKVKPGTRDAKLKAVTEKELRKKLNRSFEEDKKLAFDEELGNMIGEQVYAKQLRQRETQAKIDREIMQVIFPCWEESTDEAVVESVLDTIRVVK